MNCNISKTVKPFFGNFTVSGGDPYLILYVYIYIIDLDPLFFNQVDSELNERNNKNYLSIISHVQETYKVLMVKFNNLNSEDHLDIENTEIKLHNMLNHHVIIDKIIPRIKNEFKKREQENQSLISKEFVNKISGY